MYCTIFAEDKAQTADSGCHVAGHFQPEIQGLRAIAVLAVIWAHAELPGLPGGFTEVDVFFVISGFLITRLLLTELEETGGIDLLAFWSRRVRRLLPNAYAALIGTVLLAVFVFPGYDLLKLRRDVIWAALEIVNFRLAEARVDYFNPERLPSPVQHFWSLSIEEQFYLAWPVLLLISGVLFRGANRRAIVLLGVVWFASFAASVVMTASVPYAAYFHTGTRCWQLATGGLLAAGWPSIVLLPRAMRVAMAWLGLTVIVASFALMTGDGYPSAWALPPTLGAAGLMAGFGAASPGGFLRRGLSASPMRWIGARSYSWYLWHWPLIVLPAITYPEIDHIGIVAMPISLAVASAAYAFIEQPMHKGRLLARPLYAFTAAAAGLVLVVVAGRHASFMQRTWNAEVANRLIEIQKVAADKPQMEKDGCFLIRAQVEQPPCRYGDANGVRRAVLFGDSRAAQWFDPIDAAARETGWQLAAWSRAACPWLDIPTDSQKNPIACRKWREAMVSRLVGPHRPDLIILSTATFYYLNMYDMSSGEPISPDQGKQLWAQGYRKVLDRLLASGAKILMIRDTPVTDKNFRIVCLLRNSNCATTRTKATYSHFMEAGIIREYGDRVKIVDFNDSICDARDCPVKRNGMSIYRDKTHISRTFALTFTPQMIGLLKGFNTDLAATDQGDRAAQPAPEILSARK